MKVLAVLVFAGLVAGAVYYATKTNTWPMERCYSQAPFGPNDRVCVFTIGR